LPVAYHSDPVTLQNMEIAVLIDRPLNGKVKHECGKSTILKKKKKTHTHTKKHRTEEYSN